MFGLAIVVFGVAPSVFAQGYDPDLVTLDGTLPPEEIPTADDFRHAAVDPEQPYARDNEVLSPDAPVVISSKTRLEIAAGASRYLQGSVKTAPQPWLPEQQLAAQRLAPPLPIQTKFLTAKDVMLVRYEPSAKILAKTLTESATDTSALLREKHSTGSSAKTAEDAVKVALQDKKTETKTEPAEKSDEKKTERAAELTGETAPALSPQMQQLRDQIRATLAANAKRPLTLQSNTPADLISFAFAYGADAFVYQTPPPGPRDRRREAAQPIYTIGSLCWNYPSAGKTLFRTDGRQVIPRIGSGLQRKPANFLAMLAMSSIAENYEIKVENNTFSVADLVRFEKQSCSRNSDLSLAMVGLSFYCDCEEEWENEFGETWSIARIVREELSRPVDQGSCDITDQLLGLSSVVQRFEADGLEVKGEILDAKKYLESYQQFAVSAQNEQGLWHPQFFLYRGIGKDPRDVLYSSAHIFRFLAYQLPPEKLNDASVVKSATALLGVVNKMAASPTITERQCEALGTALQGLAIYDGKLK